MTSYVCLYNKCYLRCMTASNVTGVSSQTCSIVFNQSSYCSVCQAFLGNIQQLTPTSISNSSDLFCSLVQRVRWQSENMTANQKSVLQKSAGQNWAIITYFRFDSSPSTPRLPRGGKKKFSAAAQQPHISFGMDWFDHQPGHLSSTTGMINKLYPHRLSHSHRSYFDLVAIKRGLGIESIMKPWLNGVSWRKFTPLPPLPLAS